MTQPAVSTRDVDGDALTASVVEEFERQVDLDPTHDAIRRSGHEADENASFEQIDAWANAIASDLLDRRSSTPEPVPLAVCAPDLMLAAALGTLKAGKFYVPVNPMHPAAHVQGVLDELGAPLLLCDRAGESAARHGRSAQSVEEIVMARSSEGRPGLQFDGARLAYVQYTSGSTGRPRGVAHSRRAMLHNVTRHRTLAIGPDDCITLISADGFVAAVSNPYVALLGGAALAPYSFRGAGVDGMIGWMKAVGVTVLYAFPSFLRQLAATDTTQVYDGATDTTQVYDGLRLAYLGGETVLTADLATARRLFPAAALSVGLNSTETGLTCLYLVPQGSILPDPVPVGYPVTDVEVVILAENGTPLPPGQPGEIVIRSEYVRPRYWSRDAAPYEDSPVPAFRSGDRGCIDVDGLVHHLGRFDEMVKIRGFRVETTAVEAVISVLDSVAEVAVFGSEEDRSAVELTACVVAQGAGVDPIAVRSAVAHELPAAMIPTRVLVVDALPRTPNGKLNRKLLAQLVVRPSVPATPANAGGLAEGTGALNGDAGWASVERRIIEIWSSVLGTADMTVDDDFFALGGTSISALSLVSQVRSEFGVPMPLTVLFDTPTVTALAAAVMELRGENALERGHVTRSIAVRLAREADFADICALGNYYIENTTFSFRTEPQAPEKWIKHWSSTRAGYPWLVATIDDAVAGFAYAGPWKGQLAHAWCAEVTVCVAREAKRLGVGRALYRRLLELLDRQGYRTEIAAIALPNESSVALNEAFGFRYAGTLRGVGYKHGSWLDVGFWQRWRPGSDEPPHTAPGLRE